MAEMKLVVEVKTGPVLRTAIALVRTTRATLKLVPEWHTIERKKLRRRLKRFERVLLAAIEDTKL